jgi:hypothetical protein
MIGFESAVNQFGLLENLNLNAFDQETKKNVVINESLNGSLIDNLQGDVTDKISFLENDPNFLNGLFEDVSQIPSYREMLQGILNIVTIDLLSYSDLIKVYVAWISDQIPRTRSLMYQEILEQQNIFEEELTRQAEANDRRNQLRNQLLNPNLIQAEVKTVPEGTFDSIDLEPIGKYFYCCSNQIIQHYFNLNTYIRYCEFSGNVARNCSVCPLCKELMIPQVYRNPDIRSPPPMRRNLRRPMLPTPPQSPPTQNGNMRRRIIFDDYNDQE